MPKEERDAFIDHLKRRTNSLLDDAEQTVEKVEHFMDEIKLKEEDEWVDKLIIVKKMFKDLYGSEKHLFARRCNYLIVVSITKRYNIFSI